MSATATTTVICRCCRGPIGPSAADHDLHMLRCLDAPPHVRRAALQRIARRLQAAINEVQARDALHQAQRGGRATDIDRQRLRDAMAELDATNGTSSATP